MVARRAHNPKVIGSNPVPATKDFKGLEEKPSKPFLFSAPFFYPIFHEYSGEKPV